VRCRTGECLRRTSYTPIGTAISANIRPGWRRCAEQARDRAGLSDLAQCIRGGVAGAAFYVHFAEHPSRRGT